MLPLLRCFFAHLLILQYPDHHQNLISSSLYYSGPVHKISSQSVHNFLSYVVHRQTNRQTNRQRDKLTNATKNITSFAKEVIIQTWRVEFASNMVIICISHQSIKIEIYSGRLKIRRIGKELIYGTHTGNSVPFSKIIHHTYKYIMSADHLEHEYYKLTLF